MIATRLCEVAENTGVRAQRGARGLLSGKLMAGRKGYRESNGDFFIVCF